MAKLTYPIAADGLIAIALVNLELPVLAPRMIVGTATAAVAARGILDTGSDVTCVRSSMLSQLGAPAVLKASSQSVGGILPVDLFRISLHLIDALNPQSLWISFPVLTVMELDDALPIDVLIGMDIFAELSHHHRRT